jgi:hypothetical protein
MHNYFAHDPNARPADDRIRLQLKVSSTDAISVHDILTRNSNHTLGYWREKNSLEDELLLPQLTVPLSAGRPPPGGVECRLGSSIIKTASPPKKATQCWCTCALGQLMFAHPLDAGASFEWLEPLGPERTHQIIIRPCEFKCTGYGFEEAHVGRTAMFVITTSCSDLAHGMSLTVRFRGPSVFVANVTAEIDPGHFMVLLWCGTHRWKAGLMNC